MGVGGAWRASGAAGGGGFGLHTGWWRLEAFDGLAGDAGFWRGHALGGAVWVGMSFQGKDREKPFGPLERVEKGGCE